MRQGRERTERLAKFVAGCGRNAAYAYETVVNEIVAVDRRRDGGRLGRHLREEQSRGSDGREKSRNEAIGEVHTIQ